MFDYHDVSDLDSLPVVSKCYYPPMSIVSSDMVKLSTIMTHRSGHILSKNPHAGVDFTLYHIDSYRSPILCNSPHINEIFPFIFSPESNNNAIWSLLSKNDHLTRETMDEFCTHSQVVMLSHPNSNPEWADGQMAQNIINSDIDESKYNLLNTISISSNPHLNDETYMSIVTEVNERYMVTLLNNPGISRAVVDEVIKVFGIGLVIASGANLPQDIIDDSPIHIAAHRVSEGRVREIEGMSAMVDMKLLENPNTPDDIIKKILGRRDDVWWGKSMRKLFPSITQRVNDMEIFHLIAERNPQNHAVDGFMDLSKVRDESDFLSAYESTALWAMLNSPYSEVVRKCMDKHPHMSDVFSQNPYKDCLV